MTEKTRIIDALGEPSLLLPALLAEALGANDRAKYYLSLIQTARAHACNPERPLTSLRLERVTAGIGDENLDDVPGNSRQLDTDLFHVPSADTLCGRLSAELESMFAPIRNSGEDVSVPLAARLAALHAQAWCDSADTISAAQIHRLTSADRERGDSAHLLMMDMHKVLNRLQTRIASEDIDGAATYDTAPGDRPLIAAFMRGVNATRPLKFDHPGLGTTATRNGGRLILQNDIGTTDAHVLVVHVEKRCVTLTYTDIHMQRLVFFQSLFEHWAVSWDDTRSRTDRDLEDGVYHMGIGRFTANNEAGLCDYLQFLGSRLVFLIDWNRARKRLRLLLPKKESLALLKWAADENLGHMGWLRAGGEQLVFDTLACAAQTPPAFGSRLDDMLERSRAAAFMQFVLRVCSESQQQGTPDDILRDRIHTELMSCFRSTRHQLIDIAAEHAALAVELASGVRDSLLDLRAADGGARIAFNAERARTWEHRADELVNLARELRHGGAGHNDFYCTLLESADDITDELEEAAFHLSLIPGTPPGAALLDALDSLAGMVVGSAQEFLKALECARDVRRGCPREDLQDFLEAVHQIMAAERRSDDAHRSFKRALVVAGDAFPQRFASTECARNLEAAADALLHTALKLRDHVLAAMLSE
jgi:uncharacterized protein Yka (UPF0111/DUF47 family)